MEGKQQSETVSTNDSQDVSTSQQESTMSDGQYGYDDGNSTSSLHDSPHDEAVSSAIMEVSGELMLGKFSSHHSGSGGSESSEISDDDVRRPASGGAIAKYPESSTGLSDNDWNPYATESDTNQTPRSPRSTASDEQNRVGFVSKATFSIAQPKDAMATVSMTTGEVTVGDMKSGSVSTEKDGGRDRRGDNGAAGSSGDRLDILRYVMDGDEKLGDSRRKVTARKDIRSPEDDMRRESPDTARSGYTEGSMSGRLSTESGQSLDTVRRESAESARSLQSDGTGSRSGRQSIESAQSGRSSRSEFDRSGESGFSGRQSADSQHSGQSGRSRGSQKSSSRSVGSDRSERLDRLSNAAGDNLKELMQFESAQRVAPGSGDRVPQEMKNDTRANRDGSGDSVSRIRLTARLEPYNPPVRSSESPERISNVAGSSGYVSIAERERLLSESPDVNQQETRSVEMRNGARYETAPDTKSERTRPSHSNTNLPRFSESLPDKAPSDFSMRRVADLFEETKRQVREAVAIPRPDPSGSEERFPLRERLTWPLHDDSFRLHENSESGEKTAEKADKTRDSEVARSLTSEEVARVLGKYAENEDSRPQRNKDLPDKTNPGGSVLVSAFDKVHDNQTEFSELPRRSIRAHDTLDSLKADEVSDDEISKRVKALLSETDHIGVLRDDGTNGRQEYIPRTIDYSRLQKDLQEIQDSLHDVPPPTANDSINIQRRNVMEGLNGETETSPKDDPRSLETTGTTTGGRESGVSEYGRRLVWDHGADLEYNEGYGGQFIGTMTTTDTLSTRLRGTGDTDTLTVRPDSAATNDTDDASEFEGTKTLTGSDITRAERIVEQVMNRRAEGDLKESVEDIIARYKNERRDLFDRLQAPTVSKPVESVREETEVPKPVIKSQRPILKDPEIEMPVSQQNGIPNLNGTKQPGLAERVYKILTAEEKDADSSDNPEEKGMAKKVYKILANERPQDQVNGILTETMAEEHEMLKKLITKPKDDSSLDDSGLNGTSESFDIDEKDIRKQLEYSQFSSPGKGEKSGITALREVTSAPYSALSNAKSLLSTQLKKMTERNFDKSIELRTPYRQAIDCYPVYGVERLGQHDPEPSEPREAWMPARRSAGSSSREGRDKALASERFFITDKDHTKRDFDGTQHRSRTYSDPFEVSPSRRAVSSERLSREGHIRSRSEEAGDVADLSQYSFAEPEYSPETRMAQSPISIRPGPLGTPQQHRPQDIRHDSSPSPTESDTSGSRRVTRLRPYRPAGTRDVYYTESGEDNNESGTTIESSHPGSDDAAPPYIPSQYLGSRRDEPVRHPTGIYGNKEKDGLSTIDENSVKDDKEKALSASGGSGKLGTNSDKHSTVTADTGYQTGTVRSRSRSPASLREESEPLRANPLERPGFKTREEFQRDFEKRERELKELLSKRTTVEPQQDPLGSSTRSDPGGMLENIESRWEYRQSDQNNEFRRLEPEPAYPEDRLRYSRSRSDTDLVAISPTESQRYSSPLQPGTRFLEFSTQQSPIFAHHESVTYQTRGAPSGVPADLPKVPIERELAQPPPPQELPRVYDRRPVLSTPELPSGDERRISPTNMKEYPVRPLEPVEPPVRPLEPGSRSQSQISNDGLGPVDLGADPRKLGQYRRNVSESSTRDRAKSPLQTRQKEMEVELEKLNKQLSDQVNEIQEKKTGEENFEDNFPPSKKVQALREVLEQEYMENLPPNINDMWARFKETKEQQSVSESSLNSTRLDALSGLLKNPTHHEVNSFIKEKKEMTERQKMEEKEQIEKLREARMKEMELEKKLAAEKAAQQRRLRRQELKNRQGLSEEESNGSYAEIILENEKKREQRRRREEAKVERRERKEGKSKSPSKKVTDENEDARKVRNKAERITDERKTSRNSKTKDESSLTDIRARHSDTMDTLFSIPEDASFEQSPSKIESEMKSRQKRQRHVIDPLMKKLRDKIKMQRDKIDKERRKELQRVEKLKKLEMLLNAKRKGKLSDKAIDVELGNVSSTTSVSHTESSHMSDSTVTGLSTAIDSDISSHESTTLKDSSVDSAIKLQVKRYPEEMYRYQRTRFVDSDSTETSDFSNIVVEKVPERKSERKSKEKKGSSKGKKAKVDEFGNKIRKERKDKRKKDVFGVELTEKDIVNQLKRYENYMTPERQRLARVENYLSPQKQGYMRDASTMYPSPITVSPPSRRRMREVLMKSEAIQTSPSVRSSSPSHAYDEVPVAPVPYMSRKTSKTSGRRPSPSPTRSAQTSFSASPPRKSSKSPSRRKTFSSPSTRKTSPSARRTSRSPPAGSRRFSPPITRRQAQSPIWKPESETPPPENSMFTPEGDENAAPNTQDMKEAQSWFIPLKPSQPWRQPLKERQAFAVRQEAWEPKSVPKSTWKDIIHGDALKDKGDPNDISRDTKFDLDPEGNPLGEDETLTDSEEEIDISKSKRLSKMTLQEAFQARRANVISRLRERQKRLNLAAEQRKMEVFLKMERDRLFQEERRKEANPDAHPYSDNLHRPTRRVISKEEMKEMTKKRYKSLPEVIEKQKMKKRQDEYSVNRIKARLFNRKIQKKVLEKAEKWGR